MGEDSLEVGVFGGVPKVLRLDRESVLSAGDLDRSGRTAEAVIPSSEGERGSEREGGSERVGEGTKRKGRRALAATVVRVFVFRGERSSFSDGGIIRSCGD